MSCDVSYDCSHRPLHRLRKIDKNKRKMFKSRHTITKEVARKIYGKDVV